MHSKMICSWVKSLLVAFTATICAAFSAMADSHLPSSPSECCKEMTDYFSHRAPILKERDLFNGFVLGCSIAEHHIESKNDAKKFLNTDRSDCNILCSLAVGISGLENAACRDGCYFYGTNYSSRGREFTHAWSSCRKDAVERTTVTVQSLGGYLTVEKGDAVIGRFKHGWGASLSKNQIHLVFVKPTKTRTMDDGAVLFIDQDYFYLNVESREVKRLSFTGGRKQLGAISGNGRLFAFFDLNSEVDQVIIVRTGDLDSINLISSEKYEVPPSTIPEWTGENEIRFGCFVTRNGNPSLRWCIGDVNTKTVRVK